MISLKQPTEPYELDLPFGISVTVIPLTTVSMVAAQASARRRIEGLETQVKERKESGLPLDGLPDLSLEGERDGLFQDLLIKELAVRHIKERSGIEDNPQITPENIAAVMSLYPVGERFFQEFTLKQVLLTAAKNGSGLSAAGTSSQAEGPATAKPVNPTAGKPAQGANTP